MGARTAATLRKKLSAQIYVRQQEAGPTLTHLLSPTCPSLSCLANTPPCPHLSAQHPASRPTPPPLALVGTPHCPHLQAQRRRHARHLAQRAACCQPLLLQRQQRRRASGLAACARRRGRRSRAQPCVLTAQRVSGVAAGDAQRPHREHVGLQLLHHPLRLTNACLWGGQN
eukprot:356694-Chlamydomonas_euryale.AAC.5